MKKRLWSTLLILCMVLSLLPTGVLAADVDTAVEPEAVSDAAELTAAEPVETESAAEAPVTESVTVVKPVYADDYAVGDWTYTVTDGTASIQKYTGSASSVTLPTKVTIDGVSYKLRAVDNYAFENCYSLQSVTIPEQFTSLGYGAFKNCTNLSSVTINGDLANASGDSANTGYPYSSNRSVFYNTGTNADSMTITFGSAVTRIPSYLFATAYEKGDDVYCHVTKVVLGSSVTTIGDHAFLRCYDLKTIQFASGGVLDTIEPYAFNLCTSLASISLPTSLKYINDHAFLQCSALKTLTVPNGVVSVDAGAFENCYALTSVVIPKTTTSLGNCAFKNCTNLGSVTINGNLANASGDSANTGYPYSSNISVFYNAGSNTDAMTVTFGSAVTRIPSYLFATAYEKGDDVYCHVTKVVVGSSVTTIGNRAFLRCYDLKDVQFASNGVLDTIEPYAFHVCTGLASISLPSSLKYINDHAFMQCTALKTITLPEGVVSVDAGAFESCTALTTVVIPKTTTSLGNCAFKNCTNLGSVTINGNLANASGDSTTTGYPYSSNTSVFYNTGVNASNFTVTFGSGVTRVPNYLFATAYDEGDAVYCRVRKVILPSSVTEIGAYAFYKCYDLNAVTFNGTKTQFSAINVGDGNDPFTGATVTYASTTKPSITTQPKSASVKTTAYATFTVKASGSGLSYQWQYLKPNGSWTNCTSATTGYNTATLKVQGVTGSTNRNGYKYRCVVKNSAGSVTSRAVTLNVLAITTQPTAVSGKVGATATFTVKATGAGLTYQWQYKDVSGSWTNSKSTTAQATCEITAARDGRLYRCKITDSAGNTITSSSAKITVKTAITTQPKDAGGPVGSTVQFTVKASGVKLSYQWQYSDDNGKTWKNSSSTGTSANCAITAARDGRLYRCKVTSSNGTTATSRTAKVVVKTALKITTQPKNYTGAVGEKAKFTVKATGDGLKYQWYYSDDNGKTWTKSSSTTASATCTITAARDYRVYRCVVTDKYGESVTSNNARLIVG